MSTLESPCVLGTCGGPRHVRLPSSTQVSPRRPSEVSVTSTALLFTPPCGSLHGPARGRESSRPPALRVASDRRGRLPRPPCLPRGECARGSFGSEGLGGKSGL